MGIPESQLETWSGQGAKQQSASTYQTIKSALESSAAGYAGNSYQVFLQGSYGNDTNIYAESDVDVVIRLDSSFHFDLSNLSPPEQQLFNATLSNGTYPYNNYRTHVVEALQKQFGQAVNPAQKAIKIMAGNGRRSADVIPAFQFRRYHKFNGNSDQDYRQGISFCTNTGERIANFPKQHSENLTQKHQMTNQWFKPTIRIFKNIRSALVERKLIAPDIAPSYFIEGLLFNIPNDNFGQNYSNTVHNCLSFLFVADRSNFVCANNLYYLLRDTSVTWSAANCTIFINAAVNLWNNWNR